MTAAASCPTIAADRRRGAALPVVLLLAALIASLAASAMRTGLSGARAAAVFAQGLRADELGRGAGDALAVYLSTADPAALRGGRIGFSLPRAEVEIDYRSESARIDANAAPVSLIVALLAAAGAEPAEADAAAARVARVRAIAAAARPEAAPAAGLPGPPPDAPQPAGLGGPPTGAPPTTPAIHDVAEIAQAWGLSDHLARLVMPSLTVSNGTPQVDPVLADRLVLTALLGSGERVDDYVQRRAQGFVNEDSARELLPVPSQAFTTFQDVAAVRAVARVAIRHGMVRRYEMILAPPVPQPGTAPGALGTAKIPVTVSWRKLS